jgi:hypothetical protein
MLFRSTAALALLASLVAAQTNNTIDPSSISSTTRAEWCQSEINTCGTLCSGDINNNTCDSTTLDYSCTCASNNSAPGLQYYIGSIQTFICEAVFANCISDNAGDAAAQNVCNENEKTNCGHLNPDNFTSAAATTTAASASATASKTGSATAASGTASSSSSKAAAATMAPVANMRNLGTGALAVGFAAMGFML